MLQLIQRDEYGQSNIVLSSDNMADLVSEAKRMITEENINNALTIDEQRDNWSYCFAEFLDEESGEVQNDVYYSGPLGHSDHKLIYVDEDGNLQETKLSNVDNVTVRFYIGSFEDGSKDAEGNRNELSLYATCIKREKLNNGSYGLAENVEIDSFDSSDLQGKSIFYLKKV